MAGLGFAVRRIIEVVDERISRSQATRIHVELGTIGAELELRLDRVSRTYVAGTYLVARSLRLPDPMERAGGGELTDAAGDHAHTMQPAGSGPHVHVVDAGGAHQHHVRRPPELAPLAAGDRVVVVWETRLEGSSMPIVLDVVEAS